ncbi:Stemmadenine O-acetyltransferase [Linum perenne]
MEVSILSRETVRPATLQSQLAKPIRLNLLDQLTPMHYSPHILFYPNINQNMSHLLNRLKWSLSKTLSLYYPLAGRVRDNFDIHNFYEGVPFVETKVNCHMSDFLGTELVPESLNNFLSFNTFSLSPETGPQLAVQLNVFKCGGLALGMCYSHKTHDGCSGSSFLRTWSSINANNSQHHVDHQPNFTQGTLTFPPVMSVPSSYMSLTQGLWFSTDGKPVTRRFVFPGESVGRLRRLARSLAIQNPTRAEALSAFIWKAIICATATSSTSSVFTQSVDLRRLTRPRLSKHSFGNLILFSDSKSSSRVEDLSHLTELVRRGVREINVEYVQRLCGENGSESIYEYYQRQAEIEEDNVSNFSCWHGFSTTKTDFGWGPAVCVGLSGAGEGDRRDVTTPYCSNSVILLENGRDEDAMEAWMTLDEQVMSSIQGDFEFLKFTDRELKSFSPMYAR